MFTMDSYVYKEIPSNRQHSRGVIFFRQFIICSGIWTFYFIYGLNLGAPTVFIPQLRREANSTSAVSDETAASISAVYGFAGTPWIYISAILAFRYGKKITLICLSLFTLAGVIVLYYSTSVTHIFIGEALLSLIGASLGILFITLISEYCSPRYRGIFLSIKSASFLWGIWIANAMGTFFHWKNIALFGIICSLYPVLIIPFWPESPYWLASMGRIDQCVASHRWLKGNDEEAEIELERLISSKPDKKSVKDSLAVIKTKMFYKPVILALLIGTQYYVTGKLVYAVFAIDVIKKITGSESTAYSGMLILDGLSVLGTYFGCMLCNFFRRRVLLLLFSSVTSMFLFIISMYLYLINCGIIVENGYISICLLSVYSIAACLGPIVLCSSIIAEVLPLKCRTVAVCIHATYERLLFTILMKLGPYLIKRYGLYVVFFSSGTISTVVVCLLYVYLPETKDKTLQEIEDCMRGSQARISRDDTNELSILKKVGQK